MALDEFIRMEFSTPNLYAKSRHAPAPPDWKRLLQNAKIIVSRREGSLRLRVEYPLNTIPRTEYVLRADCLIDDSHAAAGQEADQLKEENVFPDENKNIKEYLIKRSEGAVKIFRELYP